MPPCLRTKRGGTASTFAEPKAKETQRNQVGLSYRASLPDETWCWMAMALFSETFWLFSGTSHFNYLVFWSPQRWDGWIGVLLLSYSRSHPVTVEIQVLDWCGGGVGGSQVMVYPQAPRIPISRVLLCSHNCSILHHSFQPCVVLYPWPLFFILTMNENIPTNSQVHTSWDKSKLSM